MTTSKEMIKQRRKTVRQTFSAALLKVQYLIRNFPRRVNGSFMTESYKETGKIKIPGEEVP
jgi:hypothetical protein